MWGRIVGLLARDASLGVKRGSNQIYLLYAQLHMVWSTSRPPTLSYVSLFFFLLIIPFPFPKIDLAIQFQLKLDQIH